MSKYVSVIGIRSGRLPRQYSLWTRFLLDIIQESKGAGLRKLQILINSSMALTVRSFYYYHCNQVS